MHRLKTITRICVLIGLLSTPAVWATPVNLNWSTTASGSTSTSVVPTLLSVPGAYNFGNSLPGLSTNVPSTSFEFFDDFIFTVGSANVTSVTTAVDISNIVGVSNLQVRLFTVPDATAPGTTGTPSGTLIAAWNNPFTCGSGCTGINAIIPLQAIAAGTYDLQISGNTEPFGGSYSGMLTTAPVPVPASAWLLVSGLIGLGILGRKRSAA